MNEASQYLMTVLQILKEIEEGKNRKNSSDREENIDDR